MASLAKILPQNVAGDWFVDSTCIDCDTCRQLAPRVFGEADGYSFVQAQPRPEDERAALHALLSCPTGSIGTKSSRHTPCADPSSSNTPSAVTTTKAALADFPLPIDGEVYYCGFTSPKSYGGSSYFLRHPAGNWLIDSPKFLPQLVRRFESLGGLAHIFLTHRDDIADAEKYARHFAARRIIHRLEVDAQPDAEQIIDGFAPVELAPDFLAIPTPGHTAGHMVLLYAGRYLFTGDHLAWDRDEQRLIAFHDYCWHSWPQQRQSLARLLDYNFEWVLPGHGQRVHLPAHAMHRELASLVERIGGKLQPAEKD